MKYKYFASVLSFYFFFHFKQEKTSHHQNEVEKINKFVPKGVRRSMSLSNPVPSQVLAPCYSIINLQQSVHIQYTKFEGNQDNAAFINVPNIPKQQHKVKPPFAVCQLFYCGSGTMCNHDCSSSLYILITCSLG